MSTQKPTIADNKPTKVNLEKDTEYYFCTCGRSNKQPFCDGSHAGTSFQPMVFTADKDEEAYLCACKHTKNSPFCDGSHKQFSDTEIGKEGPGVEMEREDAPSATQGLQGLICEA